MELEVKALHRHTILKVICFLFDPAIGGPTRRAGMVYQRLSGDDVEVRIAFPASPGIAAGEFLEQLNLQVDYLNIAKPVLPRKLGKFIFFLFSLPFSFIKIRAYLKKNSPDVIHVNGAFDLLPAISAKLLKIPVVWHLNDTVFSPRLSRHLGKLVTHTASVIVTAADKVAEHYGVSGCDKQITMYAPVDTDKYPVKHKEFDCADEPLITLIGNWNWIKGQDKYIEVLKKLDSRGVKFRGCIVGQFVKGQEKYWQPIVQDLQDSSIRDLIDIPGFLPDVSAVLSNSSILLLTSHSEASPMCVLEAMASGTPCIVFDVGGVREMLGQKEHEKAGVVVPRGAIDEMVEAVESLMKEKRHTLACQIMAEKERLPCFR